MRLRSRCCVEEGICGTYELPAARGVGCRGSGPGAAAGGKAMVGNGRPGGSGHPYLNSEVDARGHGGRRVELDYGNFVFTFVFYHALNFSPCFYCVVFTMISLSILASYEAVLLQIGYVKLSQAGKPQ